MPLDTSQKIKISGTPFNVLLSFPLEAGTLIRMEIQDQQGKIIQKLEKPLSAYSASVVNNLRPFLPLIKEILAGSR